MKKPVKIAVIVLVIVALIACAVNYIINLTRHDELFVSEERAVSVALNDAGLSEAQVSGIKTDIDRHHDIWCYEIEFHTLAIEYEYTIEAESGIILDKNTEPTD